VGPEGPQGLSGTIEVGTTTTSAPGGDAEVTNTGPDESNAIFNFTIPRGEQGPEGPQGPQGPAGEGVTFQGQLDATAPDSAPLGADVGDIWLNDGEGLLDASWGLGPLAVNIGWRLIWNANDTWTLAEPAVTSDLWELNENGTIEPVLDREVYIPVREGLGGTSAVPSLVISGIDDAIDTGLTVPAAGNIGIRSDGTEIARFNADGLTVGTEISLNSTTDAIAVGNTSISSNQLDNAGTLNVGVNGDVVISATQTDVIIPTDELSVEGQAAGGPALNVTTGNVYRIDTVVAGAEVFWETVGAPDPQVGAYFTAIADAAVAGGQQVTQILDTADLHVSGDASVGGGLTVNNITFSDGSTIVTGGGGSSVQISDTPPPDPEDGDMWWNSDDGRLYIWYVDPDADAQWVDASPENAQLIAVLNDLGDVNTEVVPAVDGQGLVWSEPDQMWVRSIDPIIPEELPTGVTVTLDDPGGADRFNSKTFGLELDIINPGFPAVTPFVRTSVQGNIVFQGRTTAPTDRAESTRNAQVGDFTDQGGYYFGRYGGRFMIVAPVLEDPDNWNTATTLQGGFGQTPSLWGTFGRYPQNANWHNQKGGGSDSGNYEYGFNATYGNRNNTDMQIFYWCTTCPNGPNAGNMSSTPIANPSGIGIHGFNDWYIPARNELVYLYRQLKPSTEQNRVADNDATVALPNADPPLPVWTAEDPTMTTVELFQGLNSPHILGNETCTNAAHWSTTQRDAEKARRISFGSGWDDNRDNKDQGCSGRAIRSTSTQPITTLETFAFADETATADFETGMNVTQENTGARGVVTEIDGASMTVMRVSGTFNDTDVILAPSQTFSNTQFFLTSTDDGNGNLTMSNPSQTDPGFVDWDGLDNRFGGTGSIIFPADFNGSPVDSMFTTGTRLDVEIRLTNTVGDVDETGTVTPVSNLRQSDPTIASLNAQVQVLTDYVRRIEDRDRAPGTRVTYLNNVYTWDGDKWIQDSSINDGTAYELPLEVLE
jgi:hypothetical protein